ncbi:MAG TPA: YSC84-related protein [Burkholderiales bacterium]|nr:YSC84-related protein [Burkholderiales bacterium]
MSKNMNRRTVLAAGLAVAASTIAPAAFAKPSKAEMQADVRKMAQDTLNRLYKTQPGAKASIEGAAGYAVFSNFGMKIFFAGGGSGSGIAVNNREKKETFMKMIEIQAGLGIGVKKFRLVWVFENAADLDAFINSGYEIGGQATAAAKSGSKGESFAGAISVKPGVWLYQLTDDGLAVELTAKGTKYYKDSELN